MAGIGAGAAVLGLATAAVPADLDPARYVAGHVAVDRAALGPPAGPARPDISALPRRPDGEVRALAKGVELAEARERAEQQRADRAEQQRADRAAERPAPPADDCASSGFGGVAPHVAQAGHHLQQRFGVDDVGGVAQRPNNPTSDHPRGYALDFMVDRSTGDALAAYAEQHAEALGVKYILWETEDHYDHVHISFDDEPGSGVGCG